MPALQQPTTHHWSNTKEKKTTCVNLFFWIASLSMATVCWHSAMTIVRNQKLAVLRLHIHEMLIYKPSDYQEPEGTSLSKPLLSLFQMLRFCYANCFQKQSHPTGADRLVLHVSTMSIRRRTIHHCQQRVHTTTDISTCIKVYRCTSTGQMQHHCENILQVWILLRCHAGLLSAAGIADKLHYVKWSLDDSACNASHALKYISPC